MCWTIDTQPTPYPLISVNEGKRSVCRTSNGAHCADWDTFKETSVRGTIKSTRTSIKPCRYRTPQLPQKYQFQAPIGRHTNRLLEQGLDAIHRDMCTQTNADREGRTVRHVRRRRRASERGSTKTPPYKGSPFSVAARGFCSPGYVWFGSVPTSQLSYEYGH